MTVNPYLCSCKYVFIMFFCCNCVCICCYEAVIPYLWICFDCLWKIFICMFADMFYCYCAIIYIFLMNKRMKLLIPLALFWTLLINISNIFLCHLKIFFRFHIIIYKLFLNWFYFFVCNFLKKENSKIWSTIFIIYFSQIKIIFKKLNIFFFYQTYLINFLKGESLEWNLLKITQNWKISEYLNIKIWVQNFS